MKLLKIDASPLIYAIKGNYINLFFKLFDKLIIMDSIFQEVVVKGKSRRKRDAFVVEKFIDDGLLERHPDENNPAQYLLGTGEKAVIHATKIEKCYALIDDHKARKIAILNNINTKWTLLLFLELLKGHFITEKEFDTLISTYSKIASPSVIEYQIILEMKKLVI